MARNSVARIPAIQSRVIPALRLLGSLKAGMPFEIASTPVSAVVPLEKACSSRNSVTPCTAVVSSGGGSGTGVNVPSSCRTNAVPTVAYIAAMKKKVGTATTIPDSRTPRRFSTITPPTSTIASITRCESSPGNAETICATPEEIETATVRM